MKILAKTLFFSFLLSLPTSLFSSFFDGLGNDVVQKMREEMQDSEKLKAMLIPMFRSIEGYDESKIIEFKKLAAISDEQMRNVSLQIYKDSVKELKESKEAGIEPDLFKYKQLKGGAIFCLGLSANDQTKQFLLKIALDKIEDMSLRMEAIRSYLRAANPEETKDALMRFLVEGDRVDSHERAGICSMARTVSYDVSAEKKDAIINSLIVALSKENNKWLFRVYDDILCEISEKYKNSQNRVSMLKRLIELPSLCNADDVALPELQEKVKKLSQNTQVRAINTNLSALTTSGLCLPVSTTNVAVKASTKTTVQEAD
jgi:hypothetical protein